LLQAVLSNKKPESRGQKTLSPVAYQTMGIPMTVIQTPAEFTMQQLVMRQAMTFLATGD
jgi:hypothetical protein